VSSPRGARRLPSAAWGAVIVAGASVAATLFVAWYQAGQNREAENLRAREALRLAATAEVLGAPTCLSAEARARLAAAVLGHILPEDFAKSVRRMRANAFPETIVPTIRFNVELRQTRTGEFFTPPPTAKQTEAFRRAIERAQVARQRARRETKLLCGQLGG